MPMEISSESVICPRCGIKYGKRRGNFPSSYAALYKGMGFIPYCKNCVEDMYNSYHAKCGDDKEAMHIMCRKLDLYWSDAIYDDVIRKATPRTVISKYIQKLGNNKYIGMSYDDTLNDNGLLWGARITPVTSNTTSGANENVADETQSEDAVVDFETDITEDTMAFWGYGYPKKMYNDLEQRWQYWMNKMSGQGFDIDNMDIGTEALVKQICSLEVDIKRDRIDGKSVDKNLSVLNSLLGSANLKPTQKKDDIDSATESTPLGVWIKRWETQRPIPEPDPEFEDVDGIVRYISIWFLGHLCSMLGIKNAYCKLYEEEIVRMRIDRPEYEDEDDESVFNDIFGGDESSNGIEK